MWPSPTTLSPRTNRSSSGGRPLWSGCGTTVGLRTAAASRAYSWVRYAPSSSRRCGDSLALKRQGRAGLVGVVAKGATHVAVTSGQGADDLREGPSHLVVGEVQHATDDGIRPREADANQLLSGDERSQDGPAGVRTQRRTDPTNHTLAPEGCAHCDDRSTISASCRALRNANVDSAPWFLVAPVGRQAVAAAATDGVHQGNPQVVASLEPGGAEQHPVAPAGIPGGRPRPGAGFSDRTGLDRLLVEAGPWLAHRPAGDRGRRQVAAAVDRGGLHVEEPAEKVESAPAPGRVAQDSAGGQQRLGKDGVGVTQPRLRPWPVRSRDRHVDAGCGVHQEVPSHAVTGIAVQHLHRAETGVRHGPQMG